MFTPDTYQVNNSITLHYFTYQPPQKVELDKNIAGDLLDACKEYITALREKKQQNGKTEKRKAEDAPDQKAKKVKVDKKEEKEDSGKFSRTVIVTTPNNPCTYSSLNSAHTSTIHSLLLFALHYSSFLSFILLLITFNKQKSNNYIKTNYSIKIRILAQVLTRSLIPRTRTLVLRIRILARPIPNHQARTRTLVRLLRIRTLIRLFQIRIQAVRRRKKKKQRERAEERQN